MNTRKFKRRNYFINKEFQGKTIFHYFLLVLAGSVLFSLIFSFFSSNTLSIVYDDYHLKLGTTPEILMDKIFSTQWIFIVFGGAFVILITLFLTHRVAGPFYRFEKSLDDMLDKDVSGKITLRKKDEGIVLADKINRFNAMLSRDLARLEALNNETQALASGMDSALDPSEVSLKIHQNTEEAARLLRDFTLAEDHNG
ncbi:MAG: methyl-accepting chemotaxis protein [Desulfobacteraceae bacterium]